MHRVGRDKLSCVNLPSFGIQEGDVVIFAFGEIDVRGHIGKQRDRHNRPVDEIIETLATKYLYTILLNKALYKPALCIVYSVTPPTPPNDICYNLDFPFYGTNEERIIIANKLNSRLASLCSQVNLEFLDVYNDYANPDGSFNMEYSDGCVHIHPSFSKPIADKLNAILVKNNID